MTLQDSNQTSTLQTLGGQLRKSLAAWHYPSWWNLFILTPWILGLAFFLFSPDKYDKATIARQQITTGVISKHEPENHNSYSYYFFVGGKLYTGWQIPRVEYKIGQRVRVYYDPVNPTTNKLTNFADKEPIIGPIVGLSFGIISVVAYVALRRRSMRLNLR